jgi:hypothetical protein
VKTRFFTISDSRFFVGTVALLNSIRLTGHDADLVVLDRGLTESQRERLSAHAIMFELPAEMGSDPYLVKPFPALMPFDGIVVLVDSDMVVTDALDPILAKAAAGSICMFPDPPGDYWRWFSEWQDIFELRAPLRRQPYLNAGFLAVSTAHWPALFQRWWDVCALIPERRSSLPGLRHTPDSQHPLSQLDQDAINAILMSEVPAEKLEALPPYEWDLRRVVVEDSESLVCVSGRYRRRQPLLHRHNAPKVWQSDGWQRVRPDAYVQLLPRLLFAADLPLRLTPDCVPLWIRPGWLPNLVVNVLGPVADCYRPFPRAAVRARRAPKRLAREAKRLFA